jgi:5S rRNA maturation endonuclease (ribonuclease M5)
MTKLNKAFEQHGIQNIIIKENQAIGDCIFCGSERHFYINIENNRWDCKKCSLNGGFYSFLEKIIEYSKCGLIKLSENRDISIDTLQSFNCKKNDKGEFLIPIYSLDKRITNIKIFNIKAKTFLNTSSCKVELFNLQNYNESIKNIFICEGEWDTIVMQEILNSLKLNSNYLALGIQGANTFKSEWVTLFKDKNVYLLLDNDNAGRQGTIKITNLLFPIVNQIKSIVWPNKSEGFDIRDLYKQYDLNAKKHIYK